MASSERFYDLFRKVAALEKRISRLEEGYQELDNIVDPQGWIGEAFKLLEEDIEEVKAEVQSANRKLDLILQHLTRLNEWSKCTCMSD